MSEESMEDIVKKITGVLNKEPSSDSSSDEFSEKLKNVISNLNFNSSSDSNDSKNTSDFDVNTIFKLKSAFDKINSKDDPRNNLLTALKPYLRKEKKEKLDQYMKFMNVAKIMNIYNSTEKSGDKS